MLRHVEEVRRAFAGEALQLEAQMEPKFEEQVLVPPKTLPSHLVDALQDRIDLEVSLAEKYHVPPFYDGLDVRIVRKGLEYSVDRIEETQVAVDAGSSATTLSLTRSMDKKSNYVRGATGNMPFIPGGIDINLTPTTEAKSDEDGLLVSAPGMSRGMKFTESFKGLEELNKDEEEDEQDDKEDEDAEEDVIDVNLKSEKPSDIDYLLPEEIMYVRPRKQAAKTEAAVWCHKVDLNQHIENFEQLVPNPARTWPFELDNFQKEAVFRLEQGDSVFVAAHTSAGKTVVAEYAMSIAIKNLTKCIYTSPIKALSNQKFRDFSQEYDDVGLLTGDVQIKPDASILIMTTEILRSMLYRGADLIRDVEFIVFDEVHYVNDSERGVVWEEVIIMLPDHVKFVLLSATVPNAEEFANWVGRTKRKHIYVIYTPQRPVPLKHHLYAKKKMFEIVNESGKFNTKGYNACKDAINPPQIVPGNARGGRGGSVGGGRGGASGRGGRGASSGGAGARGRGRGGSGQVALARQQGPQRGRFNNNVPGKTVLTELFTKLRADQLLPAVVFVFSRKLVEQHALSLRSLDYNTGKEKSAVHVFIDQAVGRLREEDRELPQILMLRELLSHGIGVHHSGLLPIMKEVVEILFAKGLVKVLFATETFAMGLNLPTRTVVFSAIRKFDSKQMRYLTPGEYTQMAGRAGRRGLDTVGTVIIMQVGDEIITESALNSVILGKPMNLKSQFRLTYNMILSLLRIESVEVEEVIQQSFSENSSHVMRPEREKEILANETRLQTLQDKAHKISGMDALLEFTRLYVNYIKVQSEIFELLLHSRLEKHYCVFRDRFGIRAVGVLASMANRGSPRVMVITKSPHPNSKLPHLDDLQRYNDPFLPFLETEGFRHLPKVPADSFVLRELPLTQLEFISQLKWHGPIQPKEQENIFDFYTRSGARDFFQPVDTSKVRAVDMGRLVSELATIKSDMMKLTLNKCNKKKHAQASEIVALEKNTEVLRRQVKVANTELLPDYQQRLAVLTEGGYIDESLNVLMKGRVACEVSSGYELYVTELVLDNFLSDYEPEEIVALLSCFVFEGSRGDDVDPMTTKLANGKDHIIGIVEEVHQLANKHQVALTQDEEEFTEKNRFALVNAVYEWARGMTFNEIMSLTDVHEGLIVRVINRLDEVCRSVLSVARITGNMDLYEKVQIAQERIKRDIVFCSSLYI